MRNASKFIDSIVEIFQAGFSDQGRPATFGFEYEFPIISADGHAGNIKSLHSALDFFPQIWRREGNTFGKFTHRESGISIVPEVGYHTLEYISVPRDSLNSLYGDETKFLADLLPVIRFADLKIIGSGCQPVTAWEELHWIQGGEAGERYKIIIESIKRHVGVQRGKSVNRMLSIAAHQVHVKFKSEEDLFGALHALDTIHGLVMILLANATLEGGTLQDVHSIRPLVWQGFDNYSWPRTGIFPYSVRNFRELAKFLLRTPMLCESRKENTGTHFYSPTTETFGDFLEVNECSTPELIAEHLYHLIGTLWKENRPRPNYGTLELRTPDAQPNGMQMPATAFLVGLSLGWKKIRDEILSRYNEKVFCEIAAFAHITQNIECYGLPCPVTDLLRELLNIAHNALRQRECGEEVYLEPLKSRFSKNSIISPAVRAREIIVKQGIDAYIEEFTF